MTTKTAQFTPGPWKAERNHAEVVENERINIIADDTLIAETHHAWMDWEEQEANAHLLAAAPAMYEALHVLCREIQGAVSIENGIVSFLDGGYLDINPILAQAEGKH